MLKRHKDLLREVVTGLRHTLAGYADSSGVWQRGDLDRELERLGVAPNGTITPLDVLPNPTETEARARYVVDTQLAALTPSEREAAREELVERAAYSWINRLLALRVMEARGLTDETLRKNPDYGGLSEALFLLRAQAPERAEGADGGWWAVIDDACIAHAVTLPGLFDPRDPAVALRPTTPALLRGLAVVGGVPEGFRPDEVAAAFADPDAIGWAYQFYQEEAKAQIDAKVKRGQKVETRAEIAAKTELFTEPYMVQWLLQNSLGRSYLEAYPNSCLLRDWQFYVQRPADESQSVPSVRSVAALSVMDPCMGSGHFLREAFDMLVSMYREQQPELTAANIADRILCHHIYGIDIDPRAVQLSALTLYLRAWELIRAEQKHRTKHEPIRYSPPWLNLATAPTALSPGALERHLNRHPQDRVMRPLLESTFATLEQADVLCSLLQTSSQLDAAVERLQKPHNIDMDFDADEAELRRTITDIANRDVDSLKELLLDRIIASFSAEIGSSDVAADLFGRQAQQGARLLRLLDDRYAIVATNPPYLGSANMSGPLRTYVEKHYGFAKRDLYTAMIARCLDFCQENGRVAMVTQQGWMFLGSYAELRSAPVSPKTDKSNVNRFPGLLRAACIETLADLGPNAFEEISGEVVRSVMFVFSNRRPDTDQLVVALRVTSERTASEKSRALIRSSAGDNIEVFVVKQRAFLDMPGAVIAYWLSTSMTMILTSNPRLGTIASSRAGLMTGDGERFIRFFWEVPDLGDWLLVAHGGSYRKWTGRRQSFLRWDEITRRILEGVGNHLPSRDLYGRPLLALSQAARGALGARYMVGAAFTNTSVVVIPQDEQLIDGIAGLLNSRVSSFFVRVVSQKLGIEPSHLRVLPLPRDGDVDGALARCASMARSFKELLVQTEIDELDFSPLASRIDSRCKRVIEAWLLVAEASTEAHSFRAFDLSKKDIADVFAETGPPCGFYSGISGYMQLPKCPQVQFATTLSEGLVDAIPQAEVTHIGPGGLDSIRNALRVSFEVGPVSHQHLNDESQQLAAEERDEDASLLGRHLRIPSELFLEDLSHGLKIHPTSVYWLLEQLISEGARCKPEELRVLEDRLTVLLLRILGFRWPKQIETADPVPKWASPDGIVPITSNATRSEAAELLRERLRIEDGDLGAQQVEALLQDLTNLTIGEWLRRRFFIRHIRQFKYRPIAWYLASKPEGPSQRHGIARRAPAFECLLYFHACRSDILPRVRTHHLQSLMLAERRRADEARHVGNETAAVLAAERLVELDDFADRLRSVDEEGFACPELDQLLATEPLDRWSGDGIQAPISHDDLLRRERSWRVDLNDGVRVNIAPLQLAGVLATDVLNEADAKKAIADRARWRADERRLVREGSLPRCSWMGDEVPESAQWTDLALIRNAKREKLEVKRRGRSTSSTMADRLL